MRWKSSERRPKQPVRCSRWLVPNRARRGWTPATETVGGPPKWAKAGHRRPRGQPVGTLRLKHPPEMGARGSPSALGQPIAPPRVARRARFTAAASNAKSCATRMRPRTRARRPPCLRRMR